MSKDNFLFVSKQSGAEEKVCTVRGRTGESLAVHRNRKMKF
jgi:hypothetical protein